MPLLFLKKASAGIITPGKYAPEVIELYRLTPQTQYIYEFVSEKNAVQTPAVTSLNKKTFSFSDIRDIVSSYVISQKLVDLIDHQYAMLDCHLTDALFKGKKPVL